MSANNINVNLSFTADTSKAQQQLQSLQQSLNNITNSTSIGGRLGITDKIQEGIRAAAELQVHLQKAVNVDAGNLDFSKLSQSLKQSGTSLQQYGAKLQQLGPTGQQAFQQLAQSVAQSEIPLKRTSTLLTNMGKTLANTVKWQISSSLIHGFMGSIQKAFGYAQDLNESLNNIRIVTNKSVDEMAKFAKEANAAAKALSTTTTAYTDASLIFYQQGLDGAAVKERTDVVVKMANVTKQSVEETSNQLTAIWNNFDDGSKSLEYYADVLTKLGAATASSTDEIAGGLEKFAAIGETIGLSFEYATAALTTITAKTRQSEDVVGTALKTIFGRLEGLKLGESLEDGTSLNKYSQALENVGVHIFDSNDQLKDMDDILDDLGSKWQTLSRDQQVALAQTVGGMRQYNQLISLMDNWDFMKENLNTANDATGELANQSKIYEESWSAASKRVQASLEELYSKFIDDEFFIDLTNGLGKFIDMISGFIDSLGGLDGLLMGIGVLVTKIFSNQMAAGIVNMTNSLKLLTKSGQEALAAERAAFLNSAAKQVNPTGATEGVEAAREQAMRREIQLQETLRQNAASMNDVELEASKIALDRQRVLEQENIKIQEQIQLLQEKNSIAKFDIKGHILSGAINDIDTYGQTETQVDNTVKKLDDSLNIEEQLGKLSTNIPNLSFSKQESEIKSIVEQLKNIGVVDETLLDGFLADLKTGKTTAEETVKKLQGAAKGSTNTVATKLQKINNQVYSGKENTAQRKEGQEIIENMVKGRRKFIELTAKGTKTNEDANNSFDRTNKLFLQGGAGIKHWSQGIVGAANAAMSLGMAISSIQGAWQTFQNPNIGGWEKFASILTSVGMALTIGLPIITKITTGFFGLAAATTATAVSEGILGRVQDASNREMLEKILLNKESTREQKKELLIKTGLIGAQEAENLLNTYGNGLKKKNILSSAAMAIAKKFEKAALDAETGSIWANTAAWLSSPMFWMIAIVIGLAAAIGGLIWWISSQTTALEASNKNLEAATKGYEKATEAAEKFKNTVSDYQDAQNSLKDLTKGIQEYTDALMKANNAAFDLIHAHNLVEGADYTIDQFSGEVTIASSALNNISKQMQQNELEAHLGKLYAEGRHAKVVNKQDQEEEIKKATFEAQDFLKQYAKASTEAERTEVTKQAQSILDPEDLQSFDEYAKKIDSLNLETQNQIAALKANTEALLRGNYGGEFVNEIGGSAQLAGVKEAITRDIEEELFPEGGFQAKLTQRINATEAAALAPALGLQSSELTGQVFNFDSETKTYKIKIGDTEHVFDQRTLETQYAENLYSERYTEDYIRNYNKDTKNIGKIQEGTRRLGIFKDEDAAYTGGVLVVDEGSAKTTDAQAVFKQRRIGGTLDVRTQQDNQSIQLTNKGATTGTVGQLVRDDRTTTDEYYYVENTENGGINYIPVQQKQNGGWTEIVPDTVDSEGNIMLENSNELNKDYSEYLFGANTEKSKNFVKDFGTNESFEYMLELLKEANGAEKNELIDEIRELSKDTTNPEELKQGIYKKSLETSINKGAAEANVSTDVFKIQMEEIKKQNPLLEKNHKAWTKVTAAHINAEKNAKKFNEAYEKIKENLDESKKGTLEYTEACEDLATELNTLYDSKLFTAKLVEADPERAKRAAEGDEAAIQEMTDEVQQNAIIDLGLDINSGAGKEIEEAVNGVVNGIDVDAVKLHTSLDEAGLTEVYQKLLDSGKITGDALNELLTLQGFDNAIEMQTVKVHDFDNNKITQTIVVPDTENPGKTKTMQVPTTSLVENNGTFTFPVVKGSSIRVRNPKTIGDSIRNAGGGSKDNGSKSTPKKTKKSDIVDRYKPITAQLEKQADVLSDLNDLQDKLYGPDRLDNIDRYLDSLEKENQLLDEKLKLNKQYRQEDFNALQDFAKKEGLSLKFDADGNLENETAIQEMFWKQIKSAEDAGKESDKIKEKADLFKELAEAYAESLEIASEILQEKIDNFYEAIEKATEKYDIQLELFEKDAEKAEKKVDKSYGIERIKAEQALRAEYQKSTDYINKQALPQAFDARKGIIDQLKKYYGIEVDTNTMTAINENDVIAKWTKIKDDTSKSMEERQQANEVLGMIDMLLGGLGMWNQKVDELYDSKEENYEKTNDSKWNEFDYVVELKGIITDLEIQKIELKELFLDEQGDWDKKLQYQIQKASGIGLQQINDASNALTELLNVPETQRTAEWFEHIQEASSNLTDAVTQAYEEAQSAFGLITEGIEDIQARAMETIDEFGQVTDLLDHYKNLIDALGKETDYVSIGAIYEADLRNSKKKLNSLTQYRDTVLIPRQQELMRDIANGVYTGEALKKAEEELELINEKLLEAGQEINGTIEEIANKANEILENSIQQAVATFEEAITGGSSLEELMNDIDRLSKKQEEYLTKTNQLYETNKLIRQAQLDMDKTDNLMAKQRYQAYIKEVEQLAAAGKMSQQDLKIAQARYELLQAQIALEEAQKAKDSMRLVRGADGNWDYVYTADQSKIEEAEGKVTDAENSLYNLGLEGAQNYRDKLLEADQEYAEAAREINEKYKHDEEKRQEELSQLLQHHLEIRAGLEKEYYTAYDLLVANSSTGYADYMLGNITSTKDFETAALEMLNSFDAATSVWQENMSIATDVVSTDLENIYSWQDKISEQTNDELIPALGNEMEALSKEADAWKKVYNEIIKAYKAKATYAETSMGAVQKSAGASADEIDNAHKNNIIEKEDNIDWSQKMLDAAIKNDHYALEEAFNKRDAKEKETGKNYGYTSTQLYNILNGLKRVGFNLTHLIGVPVSTWAEFAKQEGVAFASGGYTGNWGPEGRFAMLHQKELVLNAQDTENLLTTVDAVRQIAQNLELQKLSYLNNLGSLLDTASLANFNKYIGEKSYQITFGDLVLPNVSDAQEFANTLQDIVNDAIVHANLN